MNGSSSGPKARSTEVQCSAHRRGGSQERGARAAPEEATKPCPQYSTPDEGNQLIVCAGSERKCGRRGNAWHGFLFSAKRWLHQEPFEVRDWRERANVEGNRDTVVVDWCWRQWTFRLDEIGLHYYSTVERDVDTRSGADRGIWQWAGGTRRVVEIGRSAVSPERRVTSYGETGDI